MGKKHKIISAFLSGFIVFAFFSLHAEDSHQDKLKKGEIFTNGGYLSQGAWGEMEGVVDAPPEIVWSLFIHTNDWRKYQFPNLADSRAVDDELIQKVGDSKKVKDFYKALGDRVVDPLQNRQQLAEWSGFQFQYYDLPWPLADRWVVLTNLYNESRSKDHIYEARWSKKIGNVTSLEGTISFTTFESSQKTLMTYRVVSDPGSRIPKFMIKWGVKKALPQVMQAIRREAKTLLLRSYQKALPLSSKVP